MNILEVKNLETNFKTDEGTIHAVQSLRYQIDEIAALGAEVVTVKAERAFAEHARGRLSLK